MSERPTAPDVGDETASLLGSLERQRWIFAWKCGGLDPVGLSTTVGTSSMTLGGLLKHMALVEDEYFTRRFSGTSLGEPWVEVDWDADPNWEWNSAASDTPEVLMAMWESAVARSREVVSNALVTDGFDTPGQFITSAGATRLLRRYFFDLIEEYARHLGHADLLRESVDGLVGEEPPV
jgi:hypothetical protein